MSDQLAVIVVTWRAHDAAVRGLDALTQALAVESSLSESRIIVVDSASGDGTPEKLRARFPKVQVRQLAENRGFAAAVNHGIGDLDPEVEWVLLLNPDAILGSDCLKALLEDIKSSPDVAAIGPAIVDEAGRPQPSGRRFPSLAEEIEKQWQPLLRWSRRRNLHLDGPPESRPSTRSVDWISGACMLIRRTAWQQVGPLDDSFFLYFEETDWCRRAADLGWEIRYRPDLEVVHEGGVSAEESGHELQNGCIRSYFEASRESYFRKHHGWWQARGVTFVHAVRRWGRKLRPARLFGTDVVPVRGSQS